MTLRSRLRAPLTSAVLAAVVGGLLAVAPPSLAADGSGDGSGDQAAVAADQAADEEPTKGGEKGDLTRSPVNFPRSSYLCTGYKPCYDAGMSASGYAGKNDVMYWRMYKGHNCTNYAAYRMVQSGMPNTRPWSGGGNATYWGTSNKSITNGTPAVGAVAWWKANTGPAGSAGHVAYVERVVSADQIVISQDSWGGDFSWAVVTKGSGNWPSGFVHFNDVPMTNTAVPKISGLAKVGGKLTATAGTWKPADAAVAFQWYADGKPVAGATASSLVLPKDVLGRTITVRTTATKLGYPTRTVASTATAAVLPGTIEAVTPLSIRGLVKVDNTLTLKQATWNVPGVTIAYQWYADGVAIPGGTGTTLALTPQLVGRVLAVRSTVSKSGYTTVRARTNGLPPVAPGTIRTLHPPKVTGTPHLGKVFTVDPGSYHPDGAQVSVQWLRDGAPIPGATATTYKSISADLGAVVAARVQVTSPGYTDSVRYLRASTRVRALPTMKVATATGKHRARIAVRVTSRYVPDVDGTVVIRVQGGGTHVLEMHDGLVRLRLADLDPGAHKFSVTFRTGPLLLGVVRTGTVRVR